LCALPAELALQAKDDLTKSRALFAKWLSEDDEAGEAAKLCDDARAAILSARTTEFELWVCRICLGAGGIRSKNPSKALSSKKKIFCDLGGVPQEHCHKGVWKVAKGTLGST
jgi:hypothetical protein